MTYPDFFSSLTRAPMPYDYQNRVQGRLSERRNILLTAPTGCGKTWATVAPFLYGKATGKPIADRLFYVLPLRALAASLKNEVERRCGEAQVDVRVSIQTGAEPDDELFDRGDVIFTTIDQVLSAYIHMPVSLPRRLANLNAGALVGSLVVFDEAHLLEGKGARQTMVHLLRRLEGLAQVVIATATLTGQTRELIRKLPNMVEEGPTPAEAKDIPVLASKQRRWTRVDHPLSADDVRKHHTGGRTICIVNSVGQAQALAAELLANPPREADVKILHARFLPTDRARIESELNPLLGPDARPANVILVATQVVEAGLDISADRLLTELAPANALVQRAGRCARYRPPRNEGDVFVFAPRADARGEWRLGPYREVREAVTRTWARLEGANALVLGPDGEHGILDDALDPDESEGWRALVGPMGQRVTDEEVREAWQGGDDAKLRTLVRDVQSVPVFSTDDAERIDLRRGPISIALATPTWRGFVRDVHRDGHIAKIRKLVETGDDRKLVETGDDRKLVETGDESSGEDPRLLGWSWRPVEQPRDFAVAFALPTSLASYDDRLGLVLGRAGAPAPVVYRNRPTGLAIHYVCEGYRDHVVRIVAAARIWLSKHPVALARASVRFALPSAAIEELLLVAAALHDVAKLNRTWQAAAKSWQRRKKELDPSAHPVPEEPLAHTDYDPRKDREHERQPQFARPPHAVEGALASIETIDSALAAFDLGEERHCALRRIGVSAIAHHHSPRATQHKDFRLLQNSDRAIAESLAAAGLGVKAQVPEHPTSDHRASLDDDLMNPMAKDSADWWQLYSLVVRGLRLSDQAATIAGRHDVARWETP